MHDGIHALVFILLCTESSNVFAFHPYELRGTNPAQCVPCNASSYCSAGVRYPCPLNSLAIEYADQLQECICNPGYLGVGEGPPAQIPAELVYDFTSDFNPDPWVWTASYYERVAIWLNYAASIGATTNLNFIGTREGNPDGFGYSALYTTNWTPNGREKEFFELPLPSQYTHMKIIYRINADYGATLGLYINGVLKQTCQDTRNLPPCEYETSYTGSTLLKLLVSQELMVGENLQFFFTQPKPPYSCELGLAPDWYLYGQRNTCPATKGVAANGSGSVEDCVCLPGYASQGPGVYTACLPCPAGTYSGFNSSECTPCPGNSSHNNTKQTSISACLCNAGWAGVAANGCVECAAGNFSRKNGSAACQVCGSNSNTYDYPRTECKCNKGFTPTVTVLNPPDSSRAYSSFGGNSGSSSMINSIRGWQGGTFKGDGRFDWLQMDLGQETLVAGVAIQASLICPYNGCQFVTQIGVQYATSSSQFYDAKSSTGALRFYPVSTTSNPVIDELLFDVPVWAQYIRITMYDWTSSSYAATRAGVLMWSGNCQNCPSNTFKDYTGFLRDKACTPCQQYSTSLPGSPSQDLCICNLGYFLNNASNSGSGCRGCDAGMYRTNNSCHNCPVASTSKVGSARIEDCICIPGYSGPNGGPCVACDVGKYKAINGSSSCIDCPLHTWTDETNMTVCKSCKEFLKSPGGETESTAQNTSESCFCRPGYINNGTNGTRSCAPCDPGNYSLDKNLAECTACPQHTYTDPALFPWDLTSDCRVCKLCNTSTNAAFTDHYDAARGGLGCGEASVEVCTQCPLLSSLFLPTNANQRNFGVRSCVCDENSYGLVGTACTACPVGQNRTGFIYENTTLRDCECIPGFEPDPATANLCRKCPIGKYKPELGDHNCTVCPDTFTTEITGNSNFASCVCGPGYALSADQLCVICPENTYKVGFNMNTTCPLCPSNSLVAAGAVSHSNCTCVVGFEPYNNVCNLCPTGKYGNISINIGIAMSAIASAGYQNLARACSSGACPVSTSTPHPGTQYAEVNLVDGIFSDDNNWFHSNIAFQVWVLIDMQETVDVQTVRVYNRRGGVESNRLQNFEIRIGNDATFLNNAVCVTAQSTFPDVKDFTCPMKGRYLSLQNGGNNYLNLRELEVWGKKIVPIFECLVCPQNTATNSTGVLICEACAAGKTTDGRTGQVECVCDVGTFLGANGTCQTCPESSFKATTIDKYANRGCVTCGSCAANQQVNTECNNTHDVTCRACQANSWSSAGRNLLDPCFCNAGYELQGVLCVACAVGKARQVNNSNSIVCETCGAGTFTSVSASITCGVCSAICDKPCAEKIFDFSPYTYVTQWQNYANSIGAQVAYQEFWANTLTFPASNGAFFGISGNVGSFQLTLPGPYNYLTVNYRHACCSDPVTLWINGVAKDSVSGFQSKEYSQEITPGSVLRIQETNSAIGTDLRIQLRESCKIYVKNECNASRDVICQECQTCGLGFYANNTCGVNHGNDRLDTECAACPAGYHCPGGSVSQVAISCADNRCAANQQVATLCNATHNVTCRACQANSWSYAGRTELGPCLCNAGYDLQGDLCVACPVGKARQANYNNSIVCETCAVGTFTPVSTTVSCGACSSVCTEKICSAYDLVYDCKAYGHCNTLDGRTWCLDNYKTCLASFGAYTDATVINFGGLYNEGSLPAIIEFPLPGGYDYVTVLYPNPGWSEISLLINGVTVVTVPAYTTSTYSQSITTPTTVTLHEYNAFIGTQWVITLSKKCKYYVQNECNASRDVICEKCQTCGPGFYANNTCGANYSNDRLDTQCSACPENYFCPGTPTLQQPVLCSEQRCVANQQVATLCNTTHNITCKACQPNSWSYAGRTLLDPCFCNAGYELQGELCVACPVGKARQANANNSIVCETCAVGTFTSVSASITCQFCANDCPDIPFSTHALADFRGIATEVQKNTVGNIPYYDANWNMPGAKKKWADYALSKGVGYFGFTGEGGGGFWGAHLFVEFTLPANYNWFYLTVPHPNVIKVENSAGIGLRVMINDIDVHKCMPPGCDYKRQYTPLQKLKVLATGGVLGYDLVLSVYSSTTGNMATENLYVRQECNASRDVICEKCQTCGPGFYDNNTCGANYGNDRIDTQCVPCQAGSYCPTGTGPPILCPDNGKSPAGSDDLKDCDCDPGYFRDLDGCSLCHFDYYCPGKQIQYSIACPPDSRTARRGSTSRLDCHCHTGYFRDPPESLDSFNCSLCLPGDFCFNNSAYNCSDALMVSAPGSGFFDNCTCDSGYYNNGTVCEDCPINYYCEGGKRFSCLANEWTAYEGRSYECVCMPGFYRDNDVCVPCTDDYFCEGRDDSRQACPQHSTGREASDIQHCLCNSGFEVIANANASEPHTCRACEHTDGAYKYKTGLGNRACSVCTECSPGSHSTWTQIACTPTLNALCDFCTTCHNATENPIRLLYTEQHCQQFFDTRCANCSVCDWDTEWEFSPCSEMDDSQCSPITRDRACPIGFYVGGHTRSSDSQCIPCAVRNTQYEGEWLHHFTSMGRSYGDPYSCDLTCRAFSRLTNVSDPSHGCSTCETGNVLLKEFTQNPLACEFECLPGYTKHGGDCELQTFYADPLIYWNHSLNVTHVRRQAMSNSSGRSAFQLTVGHTAHGNFAVVVGRSEPTCAGRAAVVLRAHSRTACCFSQLWRISTLNQLGLSSTTREQCSRSNPPWSERVSNTQLVFEVSDARIEELANCSRFEDGLVCELYVSIVDTLLLHHFSVPVRLELRRAAALSAVSTQTYVPLSGLHVEAQLAYVELDGSPIFVVVSDMAPLPGAGETDVVLHSAGLRLVQPPPEANCERYGTRVGSSLASDSLSLHNVSAEAWTLAGTPLRAVTFLRAPQGTQFLKLLYSLRLRERDGTIGTKNMMQVAVWRNLSQVRPVCDLPPPLLTVEDGEVFSCSGLGKTTVFAATALHRPTETVRGEVGGLTSFVARALHPHIASIAIKQMLVAFALPAAAERVTAVNVTSMHLGNLAFTDEFKTACQATELCHFRHVHQGRGMHLLNNCNATARESARAWLRINLGFVEDDGHVEALCGLAHRQSARKYAFLVVLVNTRAYLPRGALWHDLQNHSAPQSTSRVAALFEFL